MDELKTTIVLTVDTVPILGSVLAKEEGSEDFYVIPAYESCRVGDKVRVTVQLLS